MDKKQGRLIVIEGIDGSGKSTQVELLKNAMNSEVISFPRYEDNIYGRLIKRYLEGEFGQPSPYLMALAFAGDRVLARSQIESWLVEGKTVIANRYIASSKAHMGANLPVEKRREFFDWLDELEYKTHGMPKEDLTILLKIDPKIAQNNIAGGGRDIHEESLKHLQDAEKIYLQLAQTELWQVIQCSENEKMRSRRDINKDVLDALNLLQN